MRLHLSSDLALWLSLWLALAVVILSAAGCESPAKIRLTPDGTWEVTSPPKPTAPATVTLGPDGTLRVSTGNQQEQTPEMIAAGKAWISYIVGGGIMVIGAGLLVVKKYIPNMPTTAGTYTMVAGGSVIVLAMLGIPISKIPWWAVLIAAGVAAVLIVPGWVVNKRASNAQESKS